MKASTNPLNYDVLIIGAGVIGSFVARHLAKKQLRLAVLERENDAGSGVSKAHTAIVHSGYSAKPGSLKADMTVRANRNFASVCEELGVAFEQCGSIMTAKSEGGLRKINEKYNRGTANGVQGLALLNREETLRIEPNITEDVIASIYAPTTGVADPWEYCNAAIENAVDNGAEFYLNHPVTDIRYEKNTIVVYSDHRCFTAGHVINCAGLYADEINNMVEEPFFQIAPRKGEYIILDKTARRHVNGFIFQGRGPDEPKGVIVSPTVHGNLMIGPSSEDSAQKDDRSSTIAALTHIPKIAGYSVQDIPFDRTISYFTGMRPRPNWLRYNDQGKLETYEDEVKDFIITRGKNNPHFINVAGIKSPGFTCADEIGQYIVTMIASDRILQDKEKQKKRRKPVHTARLDDETLNRLVAKRPDYGEILCHCNHITRGELIDAVQRSVGATDLDGIKRRTTATMGKCHGSRCRDKIQTVLDELLAKKEEPSTLRTEQSVPAPPYHSVIIGGGIAGLSVTLQLIEQGIERIALIERDGTLGGILNQCIHKGFGVKYLGENLTGPEYLSRFLDRIRTARKHNPHQRLDIYQNTEALSLHTGNGASFVRILNRSGLHRLQTDTIVETTGCIERHIGQIFLNRNRVSGIYTAGEAQKLINLKGKQLGTRAVILGTGDIGLIMARRLHLEGITVVAILEQKDSISGLRRNKVDCADLYGIPLIRNAQTETVYGKHTVKGIAYRKDGILHDIACDLLITSVGLEPDTSLETSEKSSIEGSAALFRLGNVDYVHDLVDDIALEAEQMARNIADYLAGEPKKEVTRCGSQERNDASDYDLVCTVCPESCLLRYQGDRIIGHRCPKGKEYALRQRTERSVELTTMIKDSGTGARLPARGTASVPLHIVEETMQLIRRGGHTPDLHGIISLSNGITLQTTTVQTL